ncbi:hypothetical protein [Candidatus Palauibacter sp.]|uniref:hypothetical protein n=1 Tax=Candidatus Palauibacter sp. TaxID=3101350 RepID=UPI003B5298E2
MKTRTWTRMLGAAALAVLLAPGGGLGQEREDRPPSVAGYVKGMVLDGAGGWRAPTPADALRALRGDPDVLPHLDGDLGSTALTVLRQELESRPAAELDALANTLADLILASEDSDIVSEEYGFQRNIFSVLAYAARADGRGTPHPGSFDALVRIYETAVAKALADGGTDPVKELKRRRGPSGFAVLTRALRSILNADRTGRGADYVLAVVDASEPPDLEDTWPTRPGSLWCEAAHIMRFNTGRGDHPRKGELPALALDDEMFYQLCGYH